MKYVLLVHNNLTLQFARKAADSFQWDLEDCLWVRDRNVQLPDTFRNVLDLAQFPLFEFRFKNAFRWLAQGRHNRRILTLLDGLLSDFCPEGYWLAIPHSNDYRYHVLLTHPLCKGFYYLEEGKLSCAGNPPPKRTWKKPLLGLAHRYFLSGRVPAFPPPFSVAHPNYKGAVAFSRFAFKGFRNRIELPLPFEKKPELAHFNPILVLGPYVEFGELPFEVDVQAISEVLAYLKSRKVGRLYVKFHPAQVKAGQPAPAIRKILDSQSPELIWEEIPSGISLEEIAVSAQPDIYLATSSVAIYAQAAGAGVYTYGPRLVALYPRFKPVWEDLPAGVRALLKVIPLP